MIALDAVLTAGIHQDRGADDVGLKKDGGILNAAVHVAFGCEVHDDVGLFLFKDAVNRLAVADVRLAETEVFFLEHGGQGREVARVSQFVNADNTVLGVFIHQVEDKVAANKAGAAGYDDGHGETS